jgi:hypothetical protein
MENLYLILQFIFLNTNILTFIFSQMLKKASLFIFLICFLKQTLAQKKNNDYNYFIKQSAINIKIDGKISPNEWDSAQVATDFFQVLPMDTSKAKVKTEVRFSYDKKNIYFVFVNHNFYKGTNMVESMRRDWSFNRNDNNLLFFDTFNDLTNGFSFGANARGGQWDGLITNGGNINTAWENKWVSEVSFDNDKWIWEAAIPYKTLRYKSGLKSWGLNFSRLDLKTSEKSAWTPVPRQFPTASLAFTGNLVWDHELPAPKRNVSLIPFVYFGKSKNFIAKNGTNDFGVGFDAKIGLSSSLNLDLSVLPDFSQVEVDVQQTNLERFELLFPERRQFFIENGDIFNNFGSMNIRPFFSRRVGLNSPINFGAKVSGKINKDWRLGLMNIQTGKSDAEELAANYSVLSIQRQVFARSNIGAIYIDKFISEKPEVNPDTSGYNRTIGLEYNLASKDNKWVGKAFWFKTFNEQIKTDNNALAFSILRSTRRYTADIELEKVDSSIVANEVGFVRRKNYYRVNPGMSYLFFPKGGKVLSHGPRMAFSTYTNVHNLKLNEYIVNLSYRIVFRTQATLMLWTAKEGLTLADKFDPTNYLKAYLDAEQKHGWTSTGQSFTSKPQSLFTYALESRLGGYYAGGNRLRLNGEIAYRFQPYAALSLNANYNHLRFQEDVRLPEVLKNTKHNLWLVGPRMDFTFTNKIFLTNFFQYNNQTNNFNINSRFQWRYSPASDLYIVYTDNYTADSFTPKNRAIVLKFTYWWNV